MSFTDADIKKVAHLARLDIQDDELSGFASNISKILGLVDKIREADTKDVKPMAHPMKGLSQRLRSDEVTEVIDRDANQANAPSTESGLYLVPKVIDD